MKILKIVLLTLLTGLFLISCEKEYSFENGSNLTSGTWQFQNNSAQYNGNIDSAVIRSFSNTKVLTLAGKSLNGQESFRILLYTTDSFTTTTYVASLSQCEFDYFTPSKTIFKGDFLTGEFVVSITALSNNTITGIFSGEAEDSTGADTQITLGTFTSSIDLSPNGQGGGTPSVGTLGATSDTCSPISVSGTFTTGILLSSANTAQVQVNVTTPGTFVIATNSVNGINFSKTGVFTTAGVQNVVLNGSGTPQSEGVFYFIVTYGSSSCIFPVTFLPGTLPTGDYFPTTVNSNWVYGLNVSATTDSVLTQVIPYAPSIGGNVYASLTTELIPTSGFPDDTGYYRKSGNDYFTYGDISYYFGFDASVMGEYRFLNDALPATSTFRSPDFSGTILTIPATGYIQVTIDEKAVSATIGTLNFPDVIKVTYEYYINLVPGIPFTTEERWYARGVGLIYDNIDSDAIILELGRYTP